MTTRHTQDMLLARNEIVAAPSIQACDDHNFELPNGIYIAMGILFTGFVGVLGTAFGGEMTVSLGVIFFFLAAFFAVPSLWPRIKPAENRTKALSWGEFLDGGIATATGRASGAEAIVLVLLLPFLIFSFAIAVAVIAALV